MPLNNLQERTKNGQQQEPGLKGEGPTAEVKSLVRTINSRDQYTYFSTPRERFRVVNARVKKGEFQVRDLHSGSWFTCCPSEISVERA